ncbi:MAG: UDP-N-acetylmuramoyl-tripeptide--D-alanyl-D-alanine ligase [Candidatus Babeliales bacterium]
MRFDEHFVVRALSGVSIVCKQFPRDPQFSVDSRTLQSGDIFIALSGKQCDGHDFVAEAFNKGAAGCIVAADKRAVLDRISNDELKNKLVLVVPDTLEALIQLASAWRAQFDYPVVAITGSVGKTSTKELAAKILSVHGSSYVVSHENENTKIGLSLNLLRMRKEHTVGVFEVGTSKRGEMAILARIAQPTTAIITNIGHQHMDGLGSLQDIALEKRDIFKYFTEKSIGIINGDQSILSQVSYQHPVVKFGSKTTNQIQARKIRVSGSHISFVLKIYKDKYPVVLQQPHAGAVFNVLAATTMAYLLNIPSETIVKAIQQPFSVPGRFEERRITVGGGTLINDCYNASPESMKAALLAFQEADLKGNKIAVIGDMLGLGINSPFWHRQIGRFLRKVPSVKQVILVGSLVQWVKKTAPVGLPVEVVSTWQEASEKLKSVLAQDSVVLVKGSYETGLRNLVNMFTVNN